MNSKLVEEKATEIAKHLAEFAQEEAKKSEHRKVESYKGVCVAMKKNESKHKYGWRALDKYLDAINEKSKKVACVNLSVLVVSTANKYKGKKMPGKNFFRRWAGIDPENGKLCYAYFIKERDRVYDVAKGDKLKVFIDQKAFF